MITREKLFEAGYTYHGGYPLKNGDLYQKCIRDEKGKKYYINFLEVDFGQFLSRMPQGSPRYTYQADVQFNTHNDSTFDVTVVRDTIEEVEDFFEDMFINMDCDYYEEI